MKAAVLYGPRDIRIEEVEIPKIGPEEILVKVRTCAICATDFARYAGKRKAQTPIILGHEFAGEVVEVGENVDNFKHGDRVTVAPGAVVCGKCRFCTAGKQNLCEHKRSFGISRGYDGAFAEYARIPWEVLRAGAVFTYPNDITHGEASLAEPLGCCLNGMINSGLRPGETVVIIGDGPIGLMHLLIARSMGAGMIVVTGHHDERLKIANELGADAVINSKQVDPVQEVKQLTDGRGADVIMITLGVPSAIKQGLQMVGKLSRVNFFGGSPAGTIIELDPNLVHYKEVVITGSFSQPVSIFERALKLISSRRVNVKPLISHELPLDAIEHGFEIMERREGLKVLIKP